MKRLGQILPRLSIRSKLVIAFVGLSALPVVFVSTYGLFSNVRTMKQVALEGLTHDVQNIRERTGNFMAGVKSDLRVLRGSLLFDRFIRSEGHRSSGPTKALLQELQNELVAFARTKEIYYQIRIINEDRDEVVRVQCSGNPDSTFQWRALPSDALRQGGESFYFLLTKNLGEDQIAFSPAELVYQEDTRVPIISFAMPIVHANRRYGILVADVFARNLFQEMQAGRILGTDEKVVLVAGDGHYLYDSEERSHWNKFIASREEDNLQKDYPPAIADAIASDREGTITEGTDDIIVHTPLFPPTVGKQDQQIANGFTESLYVFESVPSASVTKDARTFAVTFLGFLVLFLGGAIVLGVLATRQFTTPISALSRGAAVLSGGNYSERLHINTGDEIEGLANQFNAMAASLEAHEREIQRHRTNLQQMVEHRTRELLDQKEKLQAILDNVASAFVLLDKEFRIQTASAAFASITGLRQADVLEQDARDVLWKNGICRVNPATVSSISGKNESHVDCVVDKGGGERYLEHSTVPITMNGQVTSYLQVITDITKRRQLERNLIQSEKLMATGEMSAIIAHGFRNSLTSIKMILQLQSESKQLGRAGKKSLGVALDSIYRMEVVVRELLSFARPAPMEFRTESLNDQVNDALTLVQPSLAKQKIRVTHRFDSRIAPMKLGTPYFKEAVVNVLLNALQALEQQDHAGRAKRVGIVTKHVILTKTLHDLRPTQFEKNDREPLPSPNAEITLRKGTECAVVSVNDNGPGIDSSILTRIFDPFFTTKTNGTGLGLPMVQRTVNAHGGIVVVKSTPGKGTTFDLVLPLNRHQED